MANPTWLDPNRPLPALLGHGLDGIVDKTRRPDWNPAPTAETRRRRYKDAVAEAGRPVVEHERQEVHGAELQANLRAYGSTIDLRLVAMAEMRAEFARRAREAKQAQATGRTVLHLRRKSRG